MGEQCSLVEPLLSAWLDGELDGAEVSTVEAHLAGCRACAVGLEGLSEVGSLLANLPVRRAPALMAPAPAPVPLDPLRPALRRVQALAVATGLLVAAAFAMGSGDIAEGDVPVPLDAFVADQSGQGLRGHSTLFFRGQPGTGFVHDPNP